MGGSLNKLLVLHDSRLFGGHELMLERFLPRLLSQGPFTEVRFVFHQENERMVQLISTFGEAVVPCPMRFANGRGDPFIGYFRYPYRQMIKQLFESYRPDRTLLVQGRIESTAVPIMAAPSDAYLVSYMPMAHARSLIGPQPFGDAVRRPLYRRLNRVIVPSPTVAEQVRQAGGGPDIRVVRNVVDPPPRADQAEARARLHVDPKRRVALMIGRLDTRQKGIDRLLAAIERDRAALRNWQFVVVGQGPGAQFVAEMAVRYPELDILQRGWTDEANAYLAAADILLLPSRWEGVPLVMLEALAYDLPVLASDLPVFREYLPRHMICDYETGSLSVLLERALSGGGRAESKYALDSLATSSEAFLNAVTAK